MSGEYCGNCKHRPGGCAFSPDPENKAMPNFYEPCIFDPPKFEMREIRHGKIISPMVDTQPYPPNSGPIRSEPPLHEGYSLVCRKHPSGLGATQFYLKDGLCYSADEEKRYLGTLEEMTPKPPSEEQMNEVLAWAKRKFNLEEAPNVYRRREDPEQQDDTETIRGITDEMAQGDLEPDRENGAG